MGEMKPERCRRRGHHDWVGSMDSLGETLDKMELEATCCDCGARFEGRGDWSDAEVD